VSAPDLRTAFMEAFRRLPLRDGVQGRLHHTVSRLTAIAPQVRTQVPPRYLKVGQTESRAELQRLIGMMEKTLAAIGSLHEPTIAVLGEVGCLPRAELRAILLQELERARQADVSRLPKQQQKQPRQLLAKGLATYLAHEFAFLTGSKPTIRTSTDDDHRTYGPFHALVRDVFAILGVHGDPTHWARHAVNAFRQHQGADSDRIAQERQAEGIQRLAAWWEALKPEERTDPIIAGLMEKKSSEKGA
jgi:hypothetical protein